MRDFGTGFTDLRVIVVQDLLTYAGFW